LSDAPDIAISYRRSGGLAGLDLVAELHSADLGDDDAATARELLAGPPAEPADSGAGRPDQFDHELTLSDGASQRTFHWRDGRIPDQARALVATLGQRAEPSRG
jgi:hypothetical protein